MGLLTKIFFKHKWKTHAKKDYIWSQKVEGTWDRVERVSTTSEVLICEKCGKIRQIEY